MRSAAVNGHLLDASIMATEVISWLPREGLTQRLSMLVTISHVRSMWT